MLYHITAKIVSPQYNCSTVDHDDYSANDVDDILSQSSMSPGSPSPHSITSLQGFLNSPCDTNTVSSVDGGYNACLLVR